MEAFDVIAQLPFEFLCPTQVQTEIEAGPAKGYAVTVPAWVKAMRAGTFYQPALVTRVLGALNE